MIDNKKIKKIFDLLSINSNRAFISIYSLYSFANYHANINVAVFSKVPQYDGISSLFLIDTDTMTTLISGNVFSFKFSAKNSEGESLLGDEAIVYFDNLPTKLLMRI